MSSSNDAMTKLCEAMRMEYGAGDDFQIDLGLLVGKHRRRFDRDQRDIEIAQLIPHGVEQVCERFGGKKRVNQYRASRGRLLLKLVQ